MNIRTLLFLLVGICSTISTGMHAMSEDFAKAFQKVIVKIADEANDELRRREQELINWRNNMEECSKNREACRLRLQTVEQNLRDARTTHAPQYEIDRLAYQQEELQKQFAELTVKEAEYKETIEEFKKTKQTVQELGAETYKTILSTGKTIIESKVQGQQAAEKTAIEGYMKNKGNQEWWDKMFKFASEPKKLAGIAGAIGLAALGIYGAREGTRVLGNYVGSILGRPTLVKESSVDSLWSRFKNAVFGKKPVKHNINEVIVKPALEEKLRMIALSTKASIKNGDPLSNVLFYGPPGTGKTMYAKALAEYAGFDYAIMSGADFSQFKEGDDITELHKLFDWSTQAKRRTGKPLLVFIDECDSFLRNRGWTTTSQKSINLTNAFLSRVEKQTSDEIMFAFATNHPEVLDPAVLSRIGDKVEFTLPDLEERKLQLALYLKKYVLAKKMTIDPSVDAQMINLAQAMQGAAGRDIDGIVVKMVKKMHLTDTKVLTYDIALQVIRETMDEKQKEAAREHKPR